MADARRQPAARTKIVRQMRTCSPRQDSRSCGRSTRAPACGSWRPGPALSKEQKPDSPEEDHLTRWVSPIAATEIDVSFQGCRTRGLRGRSAASHAASVPARAVQLLRNGLLHRGKPSQDQRERCTRRGCVHTGRCSAEARPRDRPRRLARNTARTPTSRRDQPAPFLAPALQPPPRAVRRTDTRVQVPNTPAARTVPTPQRVSLRAVRAGIVERRDRRRPGTYAVMAADTGSARRASSMW